MVLGAPRRPVRPDMPFGAFLESGASASILAALVSSRAARRSWDNVHTGRAPIALHTEPSGVAGQPGVFQRYVLERPEASPTFLAVLPIPIEPVL